MLADFDEEQNWMLACWLANFELAWSLTYFLHSKLDPCTITDLEGLEGPTPDGFPKVHSIILFMISYMKGLVNLN